MVEHACEYTNKTLKCTLEIGELYANYISINLFVFKEHTTTVIFINFFKALSSTDHQENTNYSLEW